MIPAGWACLFAMLVSCALAAEPAEVFWFGTAAVNDRLTNQFLLRNNGAEPMMVQSVTPSCDCIQIMKWPTNVAMGTTGVVDILFAPDKVGDVDYRVYVKTSLASQPEIEYAIQGVIAVPSRSPTERDWSLYVGAEDAKRIIHNPDAAVLVDVRSADGHIRIPGALQMPMHAVKTKSFLRDRQVVLIDEGYGNPALEAECRKLRKTGFTQSSIWYGGLNAWQGQGGAMEGGEAAAVRRLSPVALQAIPYSFIPSLNNKSA